MKENVRPPAAANMFYPGNREMLKQNILRYLEKADPPQIEGKIRGIIVPHAGYIYSGPTAAYSYKLLKKLDPAEQWKVLLLGPSHHIPFAGAAAPDYQKWETPLGIVNVMDVRQEIGEKESIIDVPGANDEEHSLEVQAPFLQLVLKDFVLYPLVLGNIRADWLADDLLEFCRAKDVIVAASSDLSHFHEYKEAKAIDKKTVELICNLDVDGMLKKGDACGKDAILTLMYLAIGLNWKCKLLDYRNSGDTAGDKDRVVGYTAIAFYE